MLFTYSTDWHASKNCITQTTIDLRRRTYLWQNLLWNVKKPAINRSINEQAVVRKHNKPCPHIAHHTLSQIDQNVIRLSHGHPAPSLKI